MTTPDRARVLGSAMAELRSAYTLISDPQCDPVTAMPHLRRAWQAVAWLSRGEIPQGPGGALGAWLASEHLALIPARSRSGVHSVLTSALRFAPDPRPWADAEPVPELPSTRVLLRHLRFLGRIVDALDEQERGRTPKLQLAMRWGFRALWWASGLTVVALIAFRPWEREPDGMWRAAYYPTKRFEGKPELRRDVDVNFDWGVKPPTDSIPADVFSARWDTCLVLDEKVSAAFQLLADDGARLYVDGKLVVDNWKPGRSKAKGKRIKLKKGTRHLRVEYFENRQRASIHLQASFDPDEQPSPIPADMLKFPGMEFDEDKNPCRKKKKKNKKK